MTQRDDTPIQRLPSGARLLIRIILLPVAAILHIIPHVIGYFLSLRDWVCYGGELVTYQKGDVATIGKIYKILKNQTP